jgi:hypothetical protein
MPLSWTPLASLYPLATLAYVYASLWMSLASLYLLSNLAFVYAPVLDVTCVTLLWHVFMLLSWMQLALLYLCPFSTLVASLKMSTGNNKLCSLPVALLHLLLNAPVYGAVNACPSCNPALTQELVGKPSLALFNWPAFLSVIKVKKPEDAPKDWFALTCEPNPFTRAPLILDDETRHTIASGISHLQQTCPGGDDKADDEGKKGAKGASGLDVPL